MNVVMQMDSIHCLDRSTDSSLAILHEAYKRSYAIYIYDKKDLVLHNDKVYVHASLVSFSDSGNICVADQSKILLRDADILFIRSDPPFDMNYITTTYILDHIANDVICVNTPSVLRNFSEKCMIHFLSEYMPESYIISNISDVHDIFREWKDIIIKPLYLSGGRDVHLLSYCNEKDHDVIRSFITRHKYCVVQRFLQNVKTEGDQRLLYVCGKYIGGFVRMPSINTFLSNLRVGGEARIIQEKNWSKRMCNLHESVISFLIKNNISFAGIDVIDECITEINITSPTGLRTMNTLYDKCYEKIFWNTLLENV